MNTRDKTMRTPVAGAVVRDWTEADGRGDRRDAEGASRERLLEGPGLSWSTQELEAYQRTGAARHRSTGKRRQNTTPLNVAHFDKRLKHPSASKCI
jgi:hypothetical protein